MEVRGQFGPHGWKPWGKKTDVLRTCADVLKYLAGASVECWNPLYPKHPFVYCIYIAITSTIQDTIRSELNAGWRRFQTQLDPRWSSHPFRRCTMHSNHPTVPVTHFNCTTVHAWYCYLLVGDDISNMMRGKGGEKRGLGSIFRASRPTIHKNKKVDCTFT